MSKILIVDDDEGILDAISLILEDEGYAINTTANGNEVNDRIKKFKPNLILLDVLLSGSDGREICKDLKNNSLTNRIPIIMISAHPSAKQTIKQYGADAFLPKPFGAEDLISTVKKYLVD